MSKATILLVEDEPDMRIILARVLEINGYEVKLATTGQEALEKACENPDLILLDIMLPDISGYELCQRLKQDTSKMDIPILFLSARTQQRDIDRGFEVKANGYITKPFDPFQLVERLKNTLNSRQPKD